MLEKEGNYLLLVVMKVKNQYNLGRYFNDRKNRLWLVFLECKGE